MASAAALALLLFAVSVLGFGEWTATPLLPDWIAWKNVELAADLDGDGSMEGVSLRDRRLSVWDGGQQVDALQDDWFVSDAMVADVDLDGVQDLVCLVWRLGRYGETHPFWEEQDKSEYSQHVFVFNYANNRLSDKWLSSYLGYEVLDMRADAYGRLVLDCRDGSQQLAEWQSWGFAYVDEEFPSELEGSLNAARLIAVGDVIPHQPIEDALCSFGSGDEGRSWTSLDLLNRATEDDLLVANLETPLVDEPRQAEGALPVFGAPPAFADGLVEEGFEVLLTANNHAADQGESGIASTKAWAKASGATLVGYSDSAVPKPTIMKRDGIEFALFDATCELNEGAPLSRTEVSKSICLVGDGDALVRAVAKAKDPARVTVCFLHAGQEGSAVPASDAERLAERLIDAGADAVICAHPHVAQPSKWVTTKSGATGFVCYSLGNFAASQMDPRTVLGLMVELDARVTVAKKGHAAPKATLSSVRVVPTVCHVDGQSSVCVQRLSEYTDQQAASHWLNGASARAVTLDALRQQWVDLQR